MSVKLMLAPACAIVLGVALSARGAGTELSLRISNETVPAGGMVQMKVLTTEVTPISGGRPGFAFSPSTFSGVAGFGMFDPNGEIAGAAVVNGNDVRIFYDGTATLTANYPILTVVLPVRPDAPVGSKTLFTLDPNSLWNYSTLGLVTAKINPGVVTIGGTISITDVIPGEGLQPAGTVVSVLGTGFTAKTSLRVNDVAVTNVRVVSAREMQFTLTQPTSMRGARITASGDNSVTYYAYMRGIPSAPSARTLLATTEPIFSVDQRAVNTMAAVPAMSGSQYLGIAMQNPHAFDVPVLVSLQAADGTLLHAASLVLGARHRLTLEASELLDGVVPPEGSVIRVTADAPIDAFSLLCDEGTSSVSPVLPLEAQN